MSEVTKILEAVERGDTAAADRLLPLAYNELRRIAAHKMAGEREGHTLQPTALVHEAYLRLLGPDGEERHWDNRGHFFTAAAEAMRRILIESVRRKQAVKRGGGVEHTAWDDSKFEIDVPDEELIAIDEALNKLEAEDGELARVVKLRYFAGMTVQEVAQATGVSSRTVNRQWDCARAWLFREISDG